MSLSKKAKLIIYRFREKGLEVFLEQNDTQASDHNWVLPEGDFDSDQSKKLLSEDRIIELDPVTTEDASEEAKAVEGDWHDIPSLKGLLYEDAKWLKNKLDRGGFFGVKDAFKKVLPHQYEFLKELKDILVDRNSLKNM
ncbi:MAG: hypothetical protein AAF798_04150 [Bacteroidota bacterium]